MFWKNETSEFGWTIREKVQMYVCEFSCLLEPKAKRRTNMRCLVVCNVAEEALAVCREKWPEDFILHSINKRNQQCDLIVLDSVIGLSE